MVMSTTTDTVFDAARRLQQAGRAYALVSVIKAQAPASARPGDKAIVTADGSLQGWIGGGCAQPAVLRTVREALADGRARVIRIAPTEPQQERELGEVLEKSADDRATFGDRVDLSCGAEVDHPAPRSASRSAAWTMSTSCAPFTSITRTLVRLS